MIRSVLILSMFLWTPIFPLVAGGLKKNIKFKAGTNSIKIHDGVIRAQQNLYFISASTGQSMQIKLTSLENNAGFTLYGPGFKIKKIDEFDEDIEEIEGDILFDADEKHSVWNGVLKKSGRYLIQIGSTRGNASYDLVVSVK